MTVPSSTQHFIKTVHNPDWSKCDKPFAVFDADGTLWSGDVSESLLAKLEMDGVISSETIDDVLKIIPLLADESLYSYYIRLCNIDSKIGYVWIAMVFSGLSLGYLKEQTDDLMAYEAAIPVQLSSEQGKEESFILAPKVFSAQKALIQSLRDKGIEVFVITAALEDLSRMIASDPAYGLQIATENVIGMNLVLNSDSWEVPSSGRKESTTGCYLGDKKAKVRYQQGILTPFLYPPASMSTGKECAIKEYIHPEKRPILAAGNSKDDLSMLFYSDVAKGGRRLFVCHDADTQSKIEEEIQIRQTCLQEAGHPQDADQNWIFVAAEDIR